MKKILKRDTIILVVSIVLVLITLIGSSYSFFFEVKTSDTDNTYVTGYLEISFESTSGQINLSNTVPKTESEGEDLTPYVFKVKNTGNLNYKFDLKLLSDTAVITEDGCEDIQLSQSFIRVKLNDNASVLLSDTTNGVIAEDLIINAGSEMTFELKVWLDENTTNEAIGKHFHGKIVTDGYAIDTEQVTELSVANAPELFEGMIPIKWDSNNTVVKADINNPGTNLWYNYDAKMWANAVMVTSETRESYMNAVAGSTINESDILAYWVWIPRYRYQLFNTEFNAAVYTDGECTANCPQTINIVFESADTQKSEGDSNGEWLTHPAFTFGETELSGIWVAKFEPSGTNTEGSLKAVPGVESLRNQTTAVQYSTAGLFSNVAYLTQNGVDNVDSHMAKNMEWGAVAYLSHSIYGRSEEITINNTGTNYYTGGGTGTAYITNIAQSSTGNVYGVYDMNGGAWDRVMGNLNNTALSSGLTMSNIESKYIDIYIGDSVASSKLGDALGETAGWYGDYINFVSSTYPWFARGGYYNNGTNAGAFSFGNHTGNTGTGVSFRPFLSAK